jgi:hypothetical protein
MTNGAIKNKRGFWALMKLHACLKISVIVFAGISTLMTSGCIIPSQQSVKTPQTEVQSNGPINMARPGKLLKPTIQESAEPGAEPAEMKTITDPQTPQPAPDPPSQAPGPERSDIQPLPAAAPKGAKQDWAEDQKVRQAALEKAKLFPSVKKIKICFSVKDDEWWVTLYEHAGATINLKPYTWDRDKEELQEFLVLRQIPISRLQQSLQEEEAGKACEVVDAPSAQPQSTSNPVYN